MQTLIETLLFYHPAVWWLSRQIRIERENCCDDLAVSLCGDPYTYARALADLEELRGPGGLVIAANGGSLLMRVRRLLRAPSHAGRGPGWLAGMVAVLLMAGIVAGAVGRDLITDGQSGAVTAGPAPQTAPATEGTVTLPMLAGTALAAAEAELADLNLSELALAHLALATSDLLEFAFAHADLVTSDLLELSLSHADLAMLDATQLFPLPPWPPTPPDPPSAPEPPDLAVPSVPFLPSLPSPPSVPSVPSLASQPSLPSLPSTPSSPAMPSLPSLPSQSSLPSQPSLPSLPSPPSQPSVSIDGSLSFSSKDQSHGNFTWSNGTTKLQVNYSGDIEFSDDDTDVIKLSPGGWLKIKDGGWFGGRTVEFRADESGSIQRRFWVGASEKPFEPEGRQWLAQALPKFIRQTGIGAPRRVARILKAKGPSGVLAEISLIEGSWAKRIYFGELFKTGTLDAGTVRTALAQAGKEVDSDFELASLLVSAQGLLTDDGTRKAYFEAARGIDSDFEMRRVFSSALKQGAVSPTLLGTLLDASTAIESDFEQASLLVQVAKLQPLDATARAPFFRALGTVDSDFEHRRVLTALAQQADVSPEVVAAMLESAAAIDSDFEAASMLTQIAKAHALDSALRPAFFRAVENVESPFERGRILQSIVKQPEVPAETILAVLRAASAMRGSFETSQVLLAVAARHPLTGPARDAYIDAAERLGSFEQGQVLTALVKNERLK
ncbi:MAG: M56 family metallopeptidase [Acidobacteria bacterium]|nr:M56 family metallopeptidase [Acidobacteriota bacterium]